MYCNRLSLGWTFSVPFCNINVFETRLCGNGVF
ncbi:hypothetical protein CY0110_19702 [Crocosphaera chwakensis CCY0110]|uniref:Uncharacterized protein n=1 Tax=Crocosphaera chwakensis CCY0110 TaxID=391612 RepID=A3IJS2_9CHRO|nr:hypothetical protein CY0110_19702 [Crocosphaera chwakensis CCY0110]